MKNKKKANTNKISFKEISIEHTLLAKRFCKLMGYKCIINNDKRVAIIIDPSGKKGLLQPKKNKLYYYWKGVYEPITVDQVNEANSYVRIMPTGIRKKIFGILDLNKRSINY